MDPDTPQTPMRPTPVATNRERLRYLLASRHTLIWIVSAEELRVRTEVALAASDLDLEPCLWDIARGCRDLQGDALDLAQLQGEDLPPRNPHALMDIVRHHLATTRQPDRQAQNEYRQIASEIQLIGDSLATHLGNLQVSDPLDLVRALIELVPDIPFLDDVRKAKIKEELEQLEETALKVAPLATPCDGRGEAWILPDYDQLLAPKGGRMDAELCRGLKSLAYDLQAEIDPNRASAIVILATQQPPAVLDDVAVLLSWQLPDRDEVAAMVNAAAQELPEGAMPSDPDERAKIVEAARGLTAAKIVDALGYSVSATGAVDAAVIQSEKQEAVNATPGLRWISQPPDGLESVGGLTLLKRWLDSRRRLFTAAARDYGARPPRGVLLAGVPGTGKTFTAQAVAASWQLPLLQLDLGATRSKWQGESQQQIRRALDTARAVKPCVLHIDEIEKALAGYASEGDSGVGADALSVLLQFLQGEGEGVFAVATCNQFQRLPPELTRRGRFDATFYVDLPDERDRLEVLSVTLRYQKGRDPQAYDLATVANATEGFSGAELAAVVEDAIIAAFNAGDKDISTEVLVSSAQQIIPLSQVQPEEVAKLRQWAKGRALPAMRSR